MKTRSSAPDTSADDTQPAMAAKNEAEEHKPTKMLILPANATAEARILSLKNPRTGVLGRYYFCPELGLYEFTSIAYPKSTPSSTLFTYSADDAKDEDNGRSKNSITKNSELLVATPIDAIFFALPILAPPTTSRSKSGKDLFQPLDDMLDAQEDLPKHLRYALLHQQFRPQLEKRMDRICDSVEASGEKMFRLSEEKLLKELVAKAERMASKGLPASMEEKFIHRTLETPLQSEQRQDASTVIPRTSGDTTEDVDPQPPQSDSQSSAATPSTSSSLAPSNDSTGTSQTSISDTSTPDNITQLLRLRTALSFLQSSYLQPHISKIAEETWESTKSPIDFQPLTERLKEISKLRADALASRSVTDFSRKRGMDDYEDGESRAEKKRKLEEEEKKKKAGESRGVRDLKKADTSGMKKLSSFFGKPATAKKES